MWLCNVAKKPSGYLWKNNERSVQSCISVPGGSSFFKFGLVESSIGAHSTCNNKVSPQYTEKEI